MGRSRGRGRSRAGPRIGELGFWHASLGTPPPRRPSLPGAIEADVCIVGAGYTGLWTAWALRRADPSLRVVVLEAAHVGFGASGRNGGWLSGLMPGNRSVMARSPGGRAGVVALQHHLRDAVAEVAAVCVDEGIDADLHRGGSLAVATTAAQARRLRAEVDEDRRWGLAGDDIWWLGRAEVRARVDVPGALGASFTPHCARIHPAKLVRGVADAAERAGAQIYEATPVTSIAPRLAGTVFGDVRAEWVVQATEGFTARLPGQRRRVLPMNSSMLVTEPLPQAAWEEIGWAGYETMRDGAHAYAYAQRTADGRIALGGRGVPYRFGSRIDHRGAVDGATVAALSDTAHRLFPASRHSGVAHAWCGVLGVARDWCPAVVADRTTGLAAAGGYVGDGVTASYLAGRTLADLITGADTSRVRLPWVGHRARSWEPEPLRWLGARGIYWLYRAADRAEATPSAGDSSSPWARIADMISGR